MQLRIVIVAVVSALIGAGTVASVQSFAQHDEHHRQDTSAMEAGARALHEEMMKSAKKTIEGRMPMASDTDKAFGLMMAEHHMSGIKMADIELKHGNDPAMKALAKKIKINQEKEAPQLKKLATKAK